MWYKLQDILSVIPKENLQKFKNKRFKIRIPRKFSYWLYRKKLITLGERRDIERGDDVWVDWFRLSCGNSKIKWSTHISITRDIPPEKRTWYLRPGKYEFFNIYDLEIFLTEENKVELIPIIMSVNKCGQV